MKGENYNVCGPRIGRTLFSLSNCSDPIVTALQVVALQFIAVQVIALQIMGRRATGVSAP
jgi:hypothetical protein